MSKHKIYWFLTGALVYVGLLSLASCGRNKEYIVLGVPASDTIWVYLCGLLSDIPSEPIEEWKTLDRIGKEVGITFLALQPKHRCPKLYDKLCWPSDSEKDLWQTYQEIVAAIGEHKVAGYIGFSNGGFFLNLFAQLMALEKPIVSIGAAGEIFEKNGPQNRIILMISKDDAWHYEPALSFYRVSRDSNLNVTLQEYEGGHVVPYEALKEVLQEFLD